MDLSAGIALYDGPLPQVHRSGGLMHIRMPIIGHLSVSDTGRN
jgi:hypothetical protein